MSFLATIAKAETDAAARQKAMKRPCTDDWTTEANCLFTSTQLVHAQRFMYLAAALLYGAGKINLTERNWCFLYHR